MPWASITLPLILGLTTIYSLFLLLILWGLFRLPRGDNERLYRVSVVVAAKNEEPTMRACLRALLAQDYPPQRYEVVVVDDGSTDATPDVVRTFAKRDPRVKLISTTKGKGPLRAKKRALQRGIESSRGEIILITDADCRPVPTWMRAMVRHFEPSVGLVAGHVRQEGPRLWQKIRSLERVSVAAAAGGAIGWNRGLTATGGNLGYRREVFRQVGGFHDLAKPLSGDDDLFVQLVSRRTRWSLRYAFEPEAAVLTDPPATVSQFVAQERRRTSKGAYYPRWVQAVLVEIFLTNLTLAIAVPLSLIHPLASPLPLAVFAGKVLCELLVLIRGSHLSGSKALLRFFPLLAILHIPYFLIFAVWGTLGRYRWKSEEPQRTGGDIQTTRS